MEDAPIPRVRSTCEECGSVGNYPQPQLSASVLRTGSASSSTTAAIWPSYRSLISSHSIDHQPCPRVCPQATLKLVGVLTNGHSCPVVSHLARVVLANVDARAQILPGPSEEDQVLPITSRHSHTGIPLSQDEPAPISLVPLFPGRSPTLHTHDVVEPESGLGATREGMAHREFWDALTRCMTRPTIRAG